MVADLHHNFHLSYPTTWGIIFLLRFYLVLFNISAGIRSCFFVVSIQRAHCFCHNTLSIHVFQDSEASEVCCCATIFSVWIQVDDYFVILICLLHYLDTLSHKPITKLFFHAIFSTINSLNINSCCGALMPPAFDLSQKLRHYSATWLCV